MRRKTALFISRWRNRMLLKSLLLIVIATLIWGSSIKEVMAQASPSVLYVPLIGLTSVPSPLALPNGEGSVNYSYAVKNFLKEVTLTDIQVTDNNCNPVKFLNGDDNGDLRLDFSETWRYSCSTKLAQSTQSIAVATGRANNITATHKAYTTVVVGKKDPAPLVSIINITKVATPLSLPAEGGSITFTYKVNNPGVVALSDLSVVDDKCKAISGKLGDTNANDLLDINEVWIYTCTTILKQTTTNTVKVTGYANGLKAVDDTSITVEVETPLAQVNPSFPETGGEPNLKMMIWAALSTLLAFLVVMYVFSRRIK